MPRQLQKKETLISGNEGFDTTGYLIATSAAKYFIILQKRPRQKIIGEQGIKPTAIPVATWFHTFWYVIVVRNFSRSWR